MQSKITQPHHTLVAIQVDARACKVDIPEMSMSIMEDRFDKKALTTVSYIVTLPSEAKQMILEEGGELFVPGDDQEEVRLVVYDATQDGEIKEPEAAGRANLQSSEKEGSSRCDIVCIYRNGKAAAGAAAESGDAEP